MLKRLPSSKQSTNAVVFVSHFPSALALREPQVAPFAQRCQAPSLPDGTASFRAFPAQPPSHLPMPAVSQRLRKPRQPAGGSQALLDRNPACNLLPSPQGQAGRWEGNKGKWLLVLRGTDCAGARGPESPDEPRHVGLFLGNSAPKKVAGQGTTGERAQARWKGEHRSPLSPRRDASRVQFQTKRTGRRRTQDATSRARCLPAGSEAPSPVRLVASLKLCVARSPHAGHN